MCGIAGAYGLHGPVALDRGRLQAMVRQLDHRGPDGQGFYSDKKVALGHARLSIIDLESGDQPIHNEDKTVWVVFNGEIFNYIELRKELEAQEHRFYTHSDTEVLVHLYEQYGENFVQRLNGQFAIALWDLKQEKFILARDRVGIAPLFHTRVGDQLIFGSEVKAILPALPAAPGLNPIALDQLMTFWAPVSPQTVFEGIYELSPGHILVAHQGRVCNRRYWDFEFPTNNEYHSGSESQQRDELLHLLIDATQIRLRSDVPVGAYLSGGLDSSALVALIHHFSDNPLRTFSIGFDTESFDESDYQKEMISQVNADHSRIDCSDSDIANQFIDTIWHTESPVLRTAPVPMKLLSGLVKAQGFKVVLTGEGSDEILGGYDILKEAKLRQFWAKNPASTMRPTLLKRLYPYLDVSPGRAQSYLQSFYGVDLDQPETPFFSHVPRWVTTAKCKNFFSDELSGKLQGSAEGVLAATMSENLSKWHYFNRGQYVESKTLMAGYLLCSQGDRMLMANSVEGRFPFLDHRVIEFANNLHPNVKMKVLNEKYLLKRAVEQYLPKSIVQRHKQPYRAPDIPAFFGEQTPEYVEELLSEERLQKSGYFHAKRVAMLLKKIKSGRAIGYKDNMAFTGILSTQIWHHLFVDNFQTNFKQ